MLSRDRKVLEKIIEYCDRINDNLKRIGYNKETFLDEYLFQDACKELAKKNDEEK